VASFVAHLPRRPLHETLLETAGERKPYGMTLSNKVPGIPKANNTDLYTLNLQSEMIAQIALTICLNKRLTD